VEAEGVSRLGRVASVVAPLGPYSLATASGVHVHVSGQAPLDANGELVGKGDCLVQARQVYSNLESVLAAAGCGWEDVLKLTVYLTDMARLPEASRARTELIGPESYPASTVVEVRRLADPDWMIEVEAIASKPSDAGAR
jgi:enamine deaminase RidA (YjgF/YER057c/UK114 family)